MSNLGLLYCRRGQFEDAIQCHTHALQLHDTLKNYTQICNVLCNLAEVHRLQNQIPHALHLTLKAQSIAQQTGHHDVLEIINGNLGMLYYELNRFEEAHTYLKGAIDLLEQREIKGLVALFKGIKALLHLKQAYYFGSTTEKPDARYSTHKEVAKTIHQETIKLFNDSSNFEVESAKFKIRWALLHYQQTRSTQWVRPALEQTREILKTDDDIELKLLVKKLKGALHK